MKRIVTLTLATQFLVSGCGPAAEPPAAFSIEDIVARNTAALGGQDELNAIDNMVKHSLIVEGDDAVASVFAVSRDGQMRVDIFAGGERVFAESYDGERGHQWRPGDGQSAASERGTIALSHTPQLPNHVLRLKDVEANGHRLEHVDADTDGDRSYDVLKLTLSDGFETFLWVDRESHRVTRIRNERALHVDIDSEELVIETRVSEFRKVGNILHPHLVEEVNLATGDVLVRIELRHLELNQDLPEDYFSALDVASIAPRLGGAANR